MKLKNSLKSIARKLITHRLKVLIALSLFLLSVSGAAAGWLYKDQLFPTKTVKTELNPSLLNATHYIENSFTLDLKTWLDAKEGIEQPVMVSFFIDGNSIQTQELTLNPQSQQLTFSFDATTLSEGEHTASLLMVNEEGKTLWDESGKIIKDTIPPTASSSATTTGSAKVSVATESGLIKITDTKPLEISVTLQFNETGTLVLEPVTNVTVTSTQELSSTPTVTIPANQSPFSTKYTFTDLAGHTLNGELSYYYDNKPPTFSVISPLNGTDKWGKSYALSFNPSEPVTDIHVTYKGQELSVGKHSFGHYVASTPVDIGQNVFTISAVDSNGNKGTQTVTVTITQDAEPVYWAGNPKPFRPCTQELRAECRAKTGYDYSDDCSKYRDYVNCLKPICDSTSGHNVCGDS